ncbi:BON domain-containing protein [Kitasatospora sp. NPDC101157]|uniref:BON domain-containing protein n=1 Tax=Kitasatospora sp. NPDC101157 TaxID=3364098 RepID=UPI0038050A0C
MSDTHGDEGKVSHLIQAESATRHALSKEWVLDHTLWLPPDAVHVSVDDGVVTLTGTVDRKSLIPVIERLCRAVDGVVAVHHTLQHTSDGSHLDIGAAVTRGMPGPHSAATHPK